MGGRRDAGRWQQSPQANDALAVFNSLAREEIWSLNREDIANRVGRELSGSMAAKDLVIGIKDAHAVANWIKYEVLGGREPDLGGGGGGRRQDSWLFHEPSVALYRDVPANPRELAAVRADLPWAYVRQLKAIDSVLGLVKKHVGELRVFYDDAGGGEAPGGRWGLVHGDCYRERADVLSIKQLHDTDTGDSTLLVRDWWWPRERYWVMSVKAFSLAEVFWCEGRDFTATELYKRWQRSRIIVHRKERCSRGA